jgi:polysaccharide biosynthesis/export protein
LSLSNFHPANTLLRTVRRLYPLWVAVVLAGGTAPSTAQANPDELAGLPHNLVPRQSELLPVDFCRLLREGDTSQNVKLRSDHVVFVPSALDQEVCLLGAVRMPRAARTCS